MIDYTLLGTTTTRAMLSSVGPAVRRNLTKEMRAAAEPLMADMRQRASWSTRIPGSIRAQTRYGVNTAGVFIRAGGPKAPHARLYEFGSKGNRDNIRHPLFGDREHWYEEPTRPFFYPAAKAHVGPVRRAAQQALNNAVRAAR